MNAVLLTGALVFVIACLVTRGSISWAIRRDLIDVPNDRSSHHVPTPRGGGIGLVLAFYVGACVCTYLGLIAPRFLALLATGLPVAIGGYVDDAISLSARVRLLIQSICAIAALALSSPIPPLSLMGFAIPAAVAAVLYFLGILWLTNLYNFMDGIDGIAASEAVAIGFCWALLTRFQEPATVMLTCAAAGFLIFNWPPARIFMGDIGSGFCGFLIAVLAISLAGETNTSVVLWLIPVAAFILDATLTLATRIARGENPAAPHRSHAYQHAARRLGSHLPVTAAYAAISLVWLGGAFWWAHCHLEVAAELVFVAASVPIVLALIALRAGRSS